MLVVSWCSNHSLHVSAIVHVCRLIFSCFMLLIAHITCKLIQLLCASMCGSPVF